MINALCHPVKEINAICIACFLIRWKQKEVPGTAKHSLAVSKSILGGCEACLKSILYFGVFRLYHLHWVADITAKYIPLPGNRLGISLLPFIFSKKTSIKVSCSGSRYIIEGRWVIDAEFQVSLLAVSSSSLGFCSYDIYHIKLVQILQKHAGLS